MYVCMFIDSNCYITKSNLYSINSNKLIKNRKIYNIFTRLFDQRDNRSLSR